MNEALSLYESPFIFTMDQGSQFTSDEWIYTLVNWGIQPSMTGVGRCLDNIYSERFWRTLKYEDFYLDIPESVPELKEKLRTFIAWYNEERLHSSLDYHPPKEFLEMAQIQACGHVDTAEAFPTCPQSPTTTTPLLFNS